MSLLLSPAGPALSRTSCRLHLGGVHGPSFCEDLLVSSCWAGSENWLGSSPVKIISLFPPSKEVESPEGEGDRSKARGGGFQPSLFQTGERGSR